MQLNNADEIFRKVKTETGKSEEELQANLIKIKDKYQGLLSDVGANIMLAKQFNVDLNITSTPSILKISELTSSQDGVSLYARVKFIPPVKTYTGKDGSQGKLQTIYLQDGTGETKLNLWQEKADLLSELNLEKNSLVLVKDAFVSTYNDRLDLSLRHGGTLIKDPENPPLIEKIKENFKEVSDIEQVEENPIDTIGRIINIYPINTFEGKDGKKREVLSFEISDGLKSLRCVAWEPWTQEINSNFSKGDVIKLTDVRLKEGLYDIEAYLNWTSSVIKNPKTSKKIPPLDQILALSKDLEEGKISELQDGKNYKLEGLIVSINRNNIRYFKCPECNEKVQIINNEFICERCNKVIDPQVNLFGSLDIDDGSGILKIVFFKDVVEKIYDLNKDNFKQEILEEQKLEIFDKLEDKLLGEKVKVTGRAKLNNFSSQIELLCDSVELI
ncbi:MAG: hypothetical protein WCY27_01785 [archaeon]|nr:hypothetical protein [archaeon]MDD2477758.1 hypothetical protein [Candidatus ainarchaeum sp.]MDD3084619.1 hypothetical protein [Candidatus ainarchaeum sp.]MDD4221335.1 hypothetical protein [Candidatus ainarchaeum sp.]MDD4662844.1 hypothetical protein [Candidatus ainarchaeum sp.]